MSLLQRFRSRRFSLRGLWGATTLACLLLGFVGFQLMTFRLETGAVDTLRANYLADVYCGEWQNVLPPPEEPPSSRCDDAPVWALDQMEHGRLYKANNTCWLGYESNELEMKLDEQCAAALYRLPYLEDIMIDGCGIEQATQLDFSQFQKLKRLTFYNWRLSSAEMESIARIRKLQSLVLEDAIIEDFEKSIAVNLPKLKSLERLFLDIPDFGDAELFAIHGMKNLKELALDDSTITDDGLRALKDLPSLQKLYLSSSLIQGVGLKHLAGSRMEWLHLSSSPIDDAGTETLANCFPNLKYLNLSATKVSDASIQHLLKLKALETLSLTHTSISTPAIQTLREQLNCTVYGGE